MNKKNKKGFTIVELVIVIAVIAILAAVLIPTFSNIIKTAKTNADIQIVKNFNTILATEEALDGKNGTMHYAVIDLLNGGYIVERLTPTWAQNDILWDSESDRFLLVNENGKVVYCDADAHDKSDEPAYEPLEIGKEISGQPFRYFKCYSSMDEYNEDYMADGETIKGYSIYARGIYNEEKTKKNYAFATASSKNQEAENRVKDGVVYTNVGFDCGFNYEYDSESGSGIDAVEYKNASENAQNIVIRTSSFLQKLTVNASLDTVKHYDYASSVDVIQIAANSYHENGTVGRLELHENGGHVEAESGSEIFCLMNASGSETVSDGQSEKPAIQVNEGAVVHTNMENIRGTDGIRNTSTTTASVSKDQITGVADSHVNDCGAGWHTFSQFVVDDEHIYDVCTCCGYTVVSVRGQNSYGQDIVIKQTMNTIDKDGNVSQAKVVPQQTFNATQNIPATIVDGKVVMDSSFDGTGIAISENPVIGPEKVDNKDENGNRIPVNRTCQHEFIYVDNGNEKHTKTCTKCGLKFEAEAHDGNPCSKCGHHVHAYTYTPNNDGTHNGTCACGEHPIMNENCDTNGINGVCSKCGYTDPDIGYRVINNNTIIQQGKNLSDLWGYALDDSSYSGSTIYILKDYGKDLGNGKDYFTYYNNADNISPISGEYTIDLNGKIIELAATPSWGNGDRLDRNAAFGGAGCVNFSYAFSKTFIFNDSVGTGKIYNSSAHTETKNQKTAAVAISQDGGTFIFNGGTYQSNNYALYVEFGDITINGGNFIGDDSVYIFNCRTDSANYVKMTINGGTFDGKFSVIDLADGGVPVVTINGGKFTDVSANKYLATGKAMVYDGSKYFEVVDASSVTTENYKGKINNKVYCSTADLALHFAQSGDTVEIFENATQDKALSINEILTVNTNGYSVSIKANGEGKINDSANGNVHTYTFVPEQHSPIEVTKGDSTTGYTSFADFTISDGMYIKLYSDIIITAPIDIEQKGSVSLDLNGHTITNTATSTNAIQAGQSGKIVTIKNGTIICPNHFSSYYGINTLNSSTTVIQDITIVTKGKATNIYSGNVTIESGTYVGKNGALWFSGSGSYSINEGVNLFGKNATTSSTKVINNNAGENHTYADYTSTHTLQSKDGMYRVVDGADVDATDGWTNVQWW